MLNSINLDLNSLAKNKSKSYQQNTPFPNIYFDNFFEDKYLTEVLNEFPDLSKQNSNNYKSNVEKNKFLAEGEQFYGEKTKQLLHYLNSEPFLKFLQILTGIEEELITDPHFSGGGFHETKKGGLLKLHADFNKHPKTKLDRRVNVLIYLNKDWEDSYGGEFELWDKEVKNCIIKLKPIFNRLAIFSTTDFSYHGHPDPLSCPEGKSRKSIALYYYSNGRPEIEVNSGLENHSTLFVKRNNNKLDQKDFNKTNLKSLIKLFLPPIFFKIINNKK